jgi:hypothetical protein
MMLFNSQESSFDVSQLNEESEENEEDEESEEERRRISSR